MKKSLKTKQVGGLILLLSLLICNQSYGQNFSQTVRGKVIDNISQAPLDGVTIFLLGSKGKGAITDEEGNFRIQNVAVGRQSFQFSYVGYETMVINKIEVLTAKELILNVAMEEQIATTKEVVVRGQKDKSKTNNERNQR